MADQRRSESRVSRSEVASPCGFSFPLGPTIPSRVRVTSAAQKTVDGVTEGEVRSEKGEKGHFHQRDDGLPASDRMAQPTETLWGQPRYPAARQGCQNGQKGETAA